MCDVGAFEVQPVGECAARCQHRAASEVGAVTRTRCAPTPQTQDLRPNSAQQETITYSATWSGDPTLPKTPAGRGGCHALSIRISVRLRAGRSSACWV